MIDSSRVKSKKSCHHIVRWSILNFIHYVFGNFDRGPMSFECKERKKRKLWREWEIRDTAETIIILGNTLYFFGTALNMFKRWSFMNNVSSLFQLPWKYRENSSYIKPEFTTVPAPRVIKEQAIMRFELSDGAVNSALWLIEKNDFGWENAPVFVSILFNWL